MRDLAAGGMPMPVSVTAKRSRAWVVVPSTYSALNETPPVSVNFIALLSRFMRIWRNRTGSPLR
jgi:hypothetical protein